ncbi:MAG: GAF domain-containing sensor histidine kinase [Microcoleus sp. PH2017_15_JOR_U_A]|uniref:GAF domain-containing sensor histidine kinase n=1 Tax=unclassified Microcoleus TaxID=2642155 RepID=UPI001DD8F1DE|nr:MULTISPECIES: GAF domain-containing sensor histidine kinase [unclassified Microcoleus]TAG72381.1 MAG: sensor histidine kinase [Oscillatoriales cyanobacterium]MCC3474235.1 GAF domain-containing sensor histidine kinase [Microcoleus sp. PH2017_13_LAR_U_A]MCC3486644.1 GAF domain-containing sensor histidine kinase [Microcoleus sp. PH2017_14_LAR_D_A]MCC3498833.1 GAF domain-containing sensor histidine kinase [Microcoleus sp. PH2017_15_JOR_U_A]MCC3598229.1 GAF domain-containing sensor histidine kin
MDSNTDFRRSNLASTAFFQELGAELVFTQDARGRYLSFYWQKAEEYNLTAEEIVVSEALEEDRPLSETLQPIAPAPYLERLRRALETLVPQRFSYPFCHAEQYFLFDLTVTPAIDSNGKATKVLVMGRLLSDKPVQLSADSPEFMAYPALPSSSDASQQMLYPASLIGRPLTTYSEIDRKIISQIAQNLHKTLDLQTIWQQTVNSLGEVLNASRCIICSSKKDSENLEISPFPISENQQNYPDLAAELQHSIASDGSPPLSADQIENLQSKTFKVVAEYRQEPYSSMLGLQLRAAEQPGWIQTLATLKPVAVDYASPIVDRFDRHSVLVAATFYEDQPNALICLHRCGNSPKWSPVELEFARELVAQVGSAIAHATLYQELEQARAEAVALSQLKSQFLANTSHELRTPLNGILGFLKLVLDGMADDPEEAHQFIEEAYQSALHLFNVINDILDIAKIEAGKMELDLAPVKLGELLQQVENFTRVQVQEKRLQFQIQTPAIEDEIILYANYQRLLQVILNLTGNAIKFTKEGGIRISAEVIKKKVTVNNQELPGIVKIRVADTGIGVSLDKQYKLFESFFQVDGARTRQYGGTGLGLAISQKLVEAMGGTVNFYSMGEGLGSTVTFTVVLYQEPLLKN